MHDYSFDTNSIVTYLVLINPDTSTERNALMRETYPRLKDYCKSRHGLEFQVIDMRWGVRDEATDDHMTSQLCMAEIAACQRLSVGPNFVVSRFEISSCFEVIIISP